MKRSIKKSSTRINIQNKMVLEVGFSHKKYSKNKVKKRYKNPKERNKMVPLINSFV
jgi:hypothetical protein